MLIRPYENTDLGKCIDLFIEVFSQEPWNDNWSLVGANQYLNDIHLDLEVLLLKKELK